MFVERRTVQQLRDLVWGLDIPHPTCPEYRELHEKMVLIMAFIDVNFLNPPIPPTSDFITAIRQQCAAYDDDLIDADKALDNIRKALRNEMEE